MKKSLLLIAAFMVSCISMFAAEVTTMEPDKDLTFEQLKSGTMFSLVSGDKAMCFPSAQNADMQALDDAYQNDVYYFKLVSLADDENADEDIKSYYLIKVYDKDGNEAPFYGGCYLNSAGWVIFRMGLNKQYGQDGKNRAVWDVQYDAEKGFSFRNINEDKYMVNAGSTTAAIGYWRCVSLKEKAITVDGPEELVIPTELQTLIDNKTVFTLKSGDYYVYGPSQQNLAVGTWAEASASTNNANGYVLENDEYYYFLRAVKTDGSNITAWTANPCWLNNNGGDVVFNMAKNQDVKNGSSWLINKLENGKYTIESVNQKGKYLAVNADGNGGTISETPAEWEFYNASMEEPEAEPVDENAVVTPNQSPDCGDGATRATSEETENGTKYTTDGGVCVIQKILDVDVTGCDYLTITFGEAIPSGIKVSFAPKSSQANFELQEGVTEFKISLSDSNCDVNDNILSQITLLTLWKSTSVVIKDITLHKINPVVLNSKGYATFSAACDAEIATKGVKAYTASKIEENNLELVKVDGVIPAGTGVVLFGGDDMANTPVEFNIAPKGDKATIASNELQATTNADCSLTYYTTNSPIYALGMENSFINFKGNNVVNNRAFIYVPREVNAKLNISFADDEATAIKNVEAKSSLNGKILENGQIVIVKNGKKFNTAGQLIK